MISLDQVQLLEKKVAAIVAKMNELQKQNTYLLAQNKEFASKNEELYAQNQVLMQKVTTFEADQGRIEQGILNALDKLNAMENDSANSSPLQVKNRITTEGNAIETSSVVTSENTTVNHTETETSTFEQKTFSSPSPVENTVKTENPNFENSSASENKENEKMSTDLNLDDDVFDFLNFEETSETSDKNNLDLF